MRFPEIVRKLTSTKMSSSTFSRNASKMKRKGGGNMKPKGNCVGSLPWADKAALA